MTSARRAPVKQDLSAVNDVRKHSPRRVERPSPKRPRRLGGRKNRRSSTGRENHPLCRLRELLGVDVSGREQLRPARTQVADHKEDDKCSSAPAPATLSAIKACRDRKSTRLNSSHLVIS